MELDDKICAHHLNLQFSENFLNSEDSPIHIELPYPINKPLKDSKIDVIDEFNRKKDNYNKQLSAQSKEFHSVRESIMNQSFTNSHATITNGLLDLCNSEKYGTVFPCDYNPYYATGTLEHIRLENNSYLIRPDYKNNLRFSDIANPWRSHRLRLELETSENITGISSYNSLLVLRYGKETSLVKLTDLNETAPTLWTKKFKRPLLDSKFDKSKAGVVQSNTKFQLYDTKTWKKLYNTHEATHFQFLSDESVLVLGPRNIRVVDLRSNNNRQFQPELNSCDYLCSAKTENNSVYLATRHYLVRTDVRFSKNVEFCSHLMKHSPCYMDFVNNFLCLSSQKFERVLFTGQPISSLPMNVPSIADTLSQCKLQRDVLLRPEVDLRLEKLVGGVKLVNYKGNTSLYTVNSVGDIFMQKIGGNRESGPVESLYRWLNKLPEPTKPLHLTSVVNASDVRFVLNKRIQSEHLRKFPKKSKKVDYFLNHYNNIYNKKNLSDLATNFVSIWDEDEEGDEREDVDLVPEVAPLDKVSKWIESSFFD